MGSFSSHSIKPVCLPVYRLDKYYSYFLPAPFIPEGSTHVEMLEPVHCSGYSENDGEDCLICRNGIAPFKF